MGQTLELDQRTKEPRQPVDPLIGRTLRHYRVVEVIGHGGMSMVYRGVDEHLHRDVAIKVLHPFLAQKPECRARLAREARAVARLEHPHILKVFDYSGDRPTQNERGGRGDDVPDENGWYGEGFIIAELVRGQTLKRFADEVGLWRVPELGALVVWQVAKALEHAHCAGVVHRDLKPENIMVREDGVLKLMDFGIAQIADQKGLTVTGTLLGSPAHMAPETIDGYPADERSDIFSLGTVLYWLVTGALPFDAATPHALLKQIVEGRMVPAQRQSPRVSDDLARVLQKALAQKPADRFESAGAMAQALGEVVERAGLQVDDRQLALWLSRSGDEIDGVKETVREAFLERAAKHLEEGQAGRALSALNRILADDADDKDARALLARIDVDAEVSEPARPALLQRVLLVLVAVGLTAGAVVVAQAFDGAPKAASDDTATAKEAGGRGSNTLGDRTAPRWATSARPVDPTPRVDAKGERPVLARPSPRDEPTRAAPDTKPLLIKPGATAVGILRDGSGATATPGAAPAAAPGAEAATPRRVAFRVAPWATIVVDGTVVARTAMAHEMELSPGPHTVLFQNPSAKDHEVRFTVRGEGPPPTITARLEPRPALLVVDCADADAFVSVEGQKGGKSAGDTVTRPLVVSLGESGTAELEVSIFKKGRRPFVTRPRFEAGRTVTVKAVLERDADDPAVARP